MTRRLLAFATAFIVLAACGSKYYTLNDFTRVPKIDTHVHLNTESPAFAEQAAHDNFRILNVNVDAPVLPGIDQQQQLALYQMCQSKDIMNFLGTFTLSGWRDPAWVSQTRERIVTSFKLGALGIKIWKNVGMVERDLSGDFIMIDHPRFDSIVQILLDHDKTLLGHFGEPRNCWLPLEQMTVNNDRNYFRRHPEYHMYLHPAFPSYEDQIEARDRFLSRHPDLRFVGAHLGSLEWNIDQLAARLDRFPNMAVDMADRICHLQYQSQKAYDDVRKFIIKYQDRLIYGSDAIVGRDDNDESAKHEIHEKWMREWQYFTTDDTMSVPEVNGQFRGLLLPRNVVDKIYHLNAVKWFKIPEARSE